jgi:frataxin
MDDSSFAALAERTLRTLFEALDAALEDADVELRDGILTIELGDGRSYVINKHAPNKQIWVSSPISGAAHFAYDAASQTWRSTRGPAELKRLLADELSGVAGTPIILD